MAVAWGGSAGTFALTTARRRPGAGHPEEGLFMFDLVFESLKKATDTTLRMQQEMYEKWVSLWPGMRPTPAAFAEPAAKFQKKWAEFYEEVLKKQRETLDTQFKAGLKNIEDAFRLAEIKGPEELRAKTAELWQKIFETLRQSAEAQLRDFQTITARWAELVTKGAA
jgi:hypothetical protein